MKMIRERHNGGFTLTEMMAAIAILAIAAALAFVAIGHNQRVAYQTEMDETAKEIYLAAQTHLTVAKSLGSLSKQTQGVEDNTTSDKGDIYYYVVGSPSSPASGNSALSNKKTMLYTMLPPMSLDETVRTGGSYIIRYQCEKDGSIARVLDVFYAKPESSGFSGGYSYTFKDSDFTALFSQASYRSTGADGVQARGNYSGAIIGYYGGANSIEGEETLRTPTLEIYNAEILAARLTNPSLFALDDVRFEFYVTGMTSGAVSDPIVRTKSDIQTIDGKQCIQVTLDSITSVGNTHFANLNEIKDHGFIPGENIRVQVYAIKYVTDGMSQTPIQTSKSAKRTTNSLFGSLTNTSISSIIDAFKKLVLGTGMTTQSVTVASTTRTASISNIRHLENLSQAVSGYDPTNVRFAGQAPEVYEQLTDLSWPAFRTAAARWSGGGANTISVYPVTGSASKAGTFMPVNWASGAFTYKGNARAIQGVTVEAAGNAGLFGVLDCASAANPGSVSDLEFVDFQVTSTDGNAGVLAGATNNVNITNVLARHQASSDATYVTGATNAGGLVGQTTGGTVKGCAAAVYVEGASVAGGLLGAVSGTSIQYSYASGHTINGTYDDEDNASTRYGSNVLSANGTAGGLVGTLAQNASIANSYSTCSVAGDRARRLVGNGTGSVGSTCYAVGAENGEAWDISDLDGTVLDASAYDDLIAGSSAAAVPYDSTLADKYNGKYQFKAIADFAGATAALGLPVKSETTPSTESPMTLIKHLSAHYGDWPAIVTWVVNS